MPEEPAHLFQNRNRKRLYNTKWLNHRSVKLNIDTINLILKGSLAWKNPRGGSAATKQLARGDDPPSSFFRHTPANHPRRISAVLETRDTEMHKVRPLLLMDLQHNPTLAVLTNLTPGSNYPCDLLPRPEYLTQEQVNVLWPAHQGSWAQPQTPALGDHRQIPLPLRASLSPSKPSGGE